MRLPRFARNDVFGVILERIKLRLSQMVPSEQVPGKEKQVRGATAKRSLTVHGVGLEGSPKRVWRWHPSRPKAQQQPIVQYELKSL